MKSHVTLFFLVCNTLVFAQTHKLYAQEKRWAIVHPFAALKVNRIQKKCYQIYNQPSLKTKLDDYSNGGELHAFRHLFFMSALAQKIKPKKLRKLGLAHEKGNYKQFLRSVLEEKEIPDSLSSVMDLKNNELGFVLGKKNKSIALNELCVIAISEIKTGNAFIMKRNSHGNYLDCMDNVIDLSRYQKSWNIPKCLIKSGNASN